jgi:hypothetical protein
LQKQNPYIEIWCVFDKDDFPLELFNNTIQLAPKIKYAYSIEAFEIWYMLHFNYYDTVLFRRQYQDKLSELLKKPYSKNSEEMFSLFKSRQKTAIKNAKRLYEKQHPLSLKDRNPITTVFMLAEHLIEQT